MRKQIKPLIPIAVTAAMLAGASPALAEEIDTTPAEPDQTVTTPSPLRRIVRMRTRPGTRSRPRPKTRM